MAQSGALQAVTREMLEPLWSRREIPTRRIAERLGVSRQAVSARARALGLPSRAGNQGPNKTAPDARFREMWLAGLCGADMARALGYSRPSCVSRRAAMMGLPPRQRVPGASEVDGSGVQGWGGLIRLPVFAEAKLSERMRGGGQ